MSSSVLQEGGGGFSKKEILLLSLQTIESEVYGVCMCAEKKIDLGFEYSITLFLASLLVSFVFLDSTPRSVSNENFALYFLHLQEKASINVLVVFNKSITHKGVSHKGG